MATVKNKEQEIISVVLSCNTELLKLNTTINHTSNPTIKKILGRCTLYDHNFTQLFESVNHAGIQTIPQGSLFENSNNNYYAYLRKVASYLSTSNLQAPGLIRSLNESMYVGVDAPKTLIDISTFNRDIKSLIKSLETINEPETLQPKYIKIKASLHKPISVYGFDINSLASRVPLSPFGITSAMVHCIIYDKRNKALMFVTDNRIINYSVAIDTFEEITPNKYTFVLDTYMRDIKEHYDNYNMLEIYFNTDKLSLKFTDNMYGDARRAAEINAKTQVR